MASVYEQLAATGYCVIYSVEEIEVLQDAAEVISGWYRDAFNGQKRKAASPVQHLIAGCGRGYFALPAKEVLEVNNSWKCKDVCAELRLAVKTAYSSLQQTAINTLNGILGTANGFAATPKQLQELLGQQQQAGNHKPSSSSILHINKYRAVETAAAAASSSQGRLLGCEAHVDKGVLTLIYSEQPGLQVMSRDGCWVPVTPGPGQLVIFVGHTLSYMTAGRLPAALHRVVVDPPAAANGSSRLSLCFKLHAAPDALLSPATISGTDAALLPERYRYPKTTQQLMAEFDATHVSIHSQASQQGQLLQQLQQPEAMPAAGGVAAGPAPPMMTAAAVAANSVTKRQGSCSPYRVYKRPCMQYTVAAQTPEIQHEVEHKYLNITVRNEMGEDVMFKVISTVLLGRVMQAYMAKTECTGYRFLFDGARVERHLTPASYNMQDGDVIDAVMEHLGD